jgi:hypothetical protein
MLADLFFLGLLLFGVLSGFVVAIVLIVGLIRKSKKTVIICSLSLIFPLFCIGSYFWYCKIYLPDLKQETLIHFSGKYHVEQRRVPNSDTIAFKGKDFYMTLSQDKTFKLDSVPYLSYFGLGKWSADGADGQFYFYNANGNQIMFASPFEENGKQEIIFNLYDGKTEVQFVKIK